MNIILTILKIAGSLGLFLYGMKILSDGLQKSAGDRMKSILQMMTGNRFMAVLTGLVITMIIQSSSATTVMVVSFVNASLMSLTQAIGVILGANIGTTVTGWIVAILGFQMEITVLALIAIAIALPMMFSSRVKLKEVSEIFLGFGLLFLGLEYLQNSMPDISQNTQALAFLARFEDGSVLSMIICVIIGTLITIVVQSSSASMAITITMAYQGWIGVYTACALCLGQNIGTTITAYLASIGASTNARRASWAHILFNVIGSVIAMILFKPFLYFVNMITPGDIYTMQGLQLQATLPTFLAMFHTVFNVANTIIFFPFIPQYSRFIEWLIKDKNTYSDKDYHFQYLSQSYVETPELYLLTVKSEIKKMGQLAKDMFSLFSGNFASDSINIKEIVSTLKDKEEYADQMQEQLTTVCVKLQQESPTPTNAKEISNILRVIDELESVTDSIYNLIKLAEQRINEKQSYTEEEKEEVESLSDLVSLFIDFIFLHLDTEATEQDLAYATKLEQDINQRHKELVESVHSRMALDSTNIPISLHILEVERNLEHIGDYCINIAECLTNAKKHTPTFIENK